MGKLEENYRRRKKRTDLQKMLLGTIAAAGIISAGLLAPNVIGAFAKLGIIPTKRQVDSIRAARNRLVQRGLLEWEENKLRLTEKGKRRLRALELKSYQFPKPKHWDERWRVLIFDIPERRKSLRDKIRLTLSSVGFIRLQDSVWIYPYDCEDLVVLLKADFKIGKDMLYMIVETLEYDQLVRARFGLK